MITYLSNLSSIRGQDDKKDALFVFGSAAILCTVQIQATSSCSHMLWIMSSLSCLFVMGLCWDTVEFVGMGWGWWLTGLQSKRAGCQGKWFLSQQHPPDVGLTVVPGVSFTLGFSPPPAVAPGPILFLISAAIVMKACSTLVAFLALVSKKGMPRESANS